MSAYGISSGTPDASVRVSDFRSDTVTRPGPEMYAAMAAAPVGDDVFCEDPTVKALEEETAALLGKEAGLYVPSGTMSNLLAILTHCNRRGCEALVGSQSHINVFEQGGAAGLGGVFLRTLPNAADGTFSLDELDANVRDPANAHFAETRLVCVENTHNLCGGKVLPQEWVQQLRERCDKHGLSLHMDGARLWNAAVKQGLSPAAVAAPAHTVSVCLSKGLGAPVGAVLCGPAEFIARARRTRKALGGGMRQAGVIAATGLHAVRSNVNRLADDHTRADRITAAVEGIEGLVAEGSPANTNLVFFGTGAELAARGVKAVEVAKELEARFNVRIMALGPQRLRAVTHLDVDDADVDKLIEGLKVVVGEFMAKEVVA